jgi:type IV pilus assembly protein PilV
MSIKFSKCHQGFTLIEVLVAFLVIAIGLLGILALQNRSLQYNHIAFLDSQAQLLINDIVERIRANPQQAADYQIGFDDSTPVAATDCSSAVCTATQIKSWDLAQWRGRVESQTYLPGAKGAVTYTAASRQVTISISYTLASVEEDEDEAEGQASKRTVSVTTRVF